MVMAAGPIKEAASARQKQSQQQQQQRQKQKSDFKAVFKRRGQILFFLCSSVFLVCQYGHLTTSLIQQQQQQPLELEFQPPPLQQQQQKQAENRPLQKTKQGPGGGQDQNKQKGGQSARRDSSAAAEAEAAAKTSVDDAPTSAQNEEQPLEKEKGRGKDQKEEIADTVPNSPEAVKEQEKKKGLGQDQEKQKPSTTTVEDKAVVTVGAVPHFAQYYVVQETNSSSTTTKATADSELMVPYFANNGFGKAFDTMQYPMGFYDAATNITYVAYQGPHEDPFICTYNHNSRQWDGPIHAGVSLLGHPVDPVQGHDGRMMAKGGKEAERKFMADNHGKPAIIMDDHGYIHMSFGAHGGHLSLRKELGINKWGDYSGGRQFHLRSSRPRDISSWDMMNHSRLDWNGCYAQLIKSPNGTLYHFVRHGSHVSCWAVQRSTDNGQTWHASYPFVLTKLRTDKPARDSWYCRFRNGVGSKDYIIMATCVYHQHNKPPNHNLEAFNVYYLELDTRTERWYNVEGKEITQDLPLTKEHADKVVQALDTENNPRFPYHYLHPGSVLMDYKGRPHILTKISVGGKSAGPKVGIGHRQMFYMKWTGAEWTEPVAVSGENGTFFENNEDGDFTVDPATGRVQVIFGSTDGAFSRIVKWESTDGGATFHRLPDLFQSNLFGKMRVSAMFHNGHPDAVIGVYCHANEENYLKVIVLGNNGPLSRPRQDAEICKEERKSLYGNSKATTCVTESSGKLPQSSQTLLGS